MYVRVCVFVCVCTYVRMYVCMYVYSIRDITAELLTKVCPNVGIESTLQPLNGEAFNSRTANNEDRHQGPELLGQQQAEYFL